MTRRLIVDAAALGRLVEAAHLARDPAVAAALADLIEAGTGREPSPWLTVPEAARALQVSERTIRRQVARGALPPGQGVRERDGGFSKLHPWGGRQGGAGAACFVLGRGAGHAHAASRAFSRRGAGGGRHCPRHCPGH